MARRNGVPAEERSPLAATQFPDFEHSLPMLLLKTREAVMERFRQTLREFDLSEQQWRVIRALAEVKELDASDLASTSYILAPSLSRILQNLESRKFTTRRTPKRDGRRVMISLTPRGRELYDKVVPHSQQSYAEIAEALGTDKLAELYELLEDVQQRLAQEAN